jgi:NAD+ kinase
MPRKEFRNIGIVAKSHSPHARSILRQLTRWLDSKRIPYLCGPGAATALRAGIDETAREEMYRTSDLLIVLGGDGTLLSVAREIAPHGLPILGVNLGSLGFLTEITLKKMSESVTEVLTGNYQVDRRMMIAARLVRGGRQVVRNHLLNDVVLNKSALARIVDIDIDIDGEFVTRYRADGLIVCTPTGSTAYSLSAGGPIIHPDMRSFCITPICPHTLTNRPLVVPSHVRIDLRLKRSTEENVYLTLDGQLGFPMKPGDRVEVRRSRHTIRLLKVPGMPYFNVLRSKLKWGGK